MSPSATTGSADTEVATAGAAGTAVSTTVAGVDGCRGRWLLVRRTLDGVSTPTAELVDDLGPLVDEVRQHQLRVLAIDMPIALLDVHPRTCDVEARRHLGPRRSSVFPAPVRAVLDATDYDEAKSLSRAAAGIAPSLQAFNLVPAIAHLDPLIEASDQDRIVEAHPELAFARLAGEPLAHPKRTAAGRAMRRRLLAANDPKLGQLIESSGLPAIDLLDAAALTVTGARIVAGDERRVGDQLDHRGRRSEIVW